MDFNHIPKTQEASNQLDYFAHLDTFKNTRRKITPVDAAHCQTERRLKKKIEQDNIHLAAALTQLDDLKKLKLEIIKMKKEYYANRQETEPTSLHDLLNIKAMLLSLAHEI